ncbi:mitochondrial inner membrane protease subunit Imp2, putative [Trichophyton benhamiae CBS 112371]|uniref:Mitochondrial inner membrane protease subunit 2 n=1 Tax=Arthroderma benhamiae (strain ATCC MYA-4681 / CBS 112371) TaxID=663331 RepID=D4AU32_ARTBC|nr:mitochondrial inner membrane protease subunit Imp2, putative [Trichophyton benhamiae CBS 112371]EFE33485.1 mitochondrial inner membrane protease subunit Imp2, putative [Trichophyton benhamiae CBS 112371]
MDGPRGRSRYSFGRNAALDTFLFTIQGLALFIVFREHVLDVKWISGASMSPYLNKGYNIDNIDSEMVLVDVTYATKLHLRRGMVVVFPTEPSKLSVKRIIALPGDVVTTRPPKSGEGDQKTQIVPWNHVWVEGDATDPDLSFDSNTYGPISMGLIKGQVMCVLRPKWRTLKWWEWENENDLVESGGDYGKSQRMRVKKDAVTVYDPNMT